MKEEKQDLYRIDQLKVREKLYEMYPPGSEARSLMEKEEKVTELSHLSKITRSNDVDIIVEAIEHLSDANVGLALRFVFFGLLGAVALCFIPNTTTTIEFGFVLGLGSFLVLSSLRSLYYFIYNIYTIKKFKKEMNKIKSRISELKQDIFNEFSR